MRAGDLHDGPLVERRVHRRRASCRRRSPGLPGRRRATDARAGHVDRADLRRIATRILRQVSRDDRARGAAVDRAADRRRLSPEARDTRIGLWRGANNMPAGWLKWVFEQYGFNHKAIVSTDFDDGSRVAVRHHRPARRHQPRDDRQRPEPRAERQGVGLGLRRRRRRAGRSSPTGCAAAARSSRSARPSRPRVSCSICRSRRPAEPRGGAGVRRRWRWRSGGRARRSRRRAATDPNRALRDAFSSPASLDAVLRDRVIDPTTLFYCPGSLLQNEFNTDASRRVRHAARRGRSSSKGTRRIA